MGAGVRACLAPCGGGRVGGAAHDAVRAIGAAGGPGWAFEVLADTDDCVLESKWQRGCACRCVRPVRRELLSACVWVAAE